LDTWFRKRFFLLILCFATCLVALSLTLVTGHLSNRGFGILAALLAVTFWVILTIFLYNAKARYRRAAPPAGTPLDTATRTRLQRSARMLQLAIVFFPMLLVFGLFLAGHNPMMVRLTGIVMNLSLTAYFYMAWRRVQAKLKNPGEVS
jgi:hypothetical protein